MIPAITVKSDLSEIALAIKQLPDSLVNPATARALNRTATTVRAEAARMIGAAYNIKVGSAKKQMSIWRASKRDLKALIKVSGRPIPLIEFDARQVKDGVSVKVKGSRKIVAHAFIATMKSGHVGIYERLSRGKGSKRLPIKQLFSLSLPVAFTQKQIMDALLAVAKERMAEVLQQEMRFVLLKRA